MKETLNVVLGMKLRVNTRKRRSQKTKVYVVHSTHERIRGRDYGLPVFGVRQCYPLGDIYRMSHEQDLPGIGENASCIDLLSIPDPTRSTSLHDRLVS